MKRAFQRNVVTATVSAALALSAPALAMDEVEQNHPIPSAHVLSAYGDASVVSSGASINGAVYNAANPTVPDVDFFSFYARKGDVLNLAIDSKSSASGSFMPVLTVFIGTPPYEKKDERYNVDLPRIDKYLVDRDGIHVVAVSGQPCTLNSGGTCLWTFVNPRISIGNYTVSISPAVPPMMQVKIELKPGSGEFAPLNPKARGNIPVALLSSVSNPKFEPFADVVVDRESLTFGSTGNEASLRKCEKEGVDLNGDTVPDMVCHFELQNAKFKPEDTRAILKGKTRNNDYFEGSGMLKVLPPKQEL